MKSTGKQLDNQPIGQTQHSSENLQEQISRRAYELYLERGEQSDAIQNWLDAEKEILGESVQPTSEQALAASVGLENWLYCRPGMNSAPYRAALVEVCPDAAFSELPMYRATPNVRVQPCLVW
jgi:hypothetical protein